MHTVSPWTETSKIDYILVILEWFPQYTDKFIKEK